MAENAPPSAGGAPPDGSRGMPYYEKLRRDLREALNRKRQLDREMVRIAAHPATRYKSLHLALIANDFVPFLDCH
jgi:hypothetical protein